MKSLIGTTLENLNQTLTEFKIIPRTDYRILESRDITDVQGVVHHYTVVACELTLADMEADEVITTYTALGASTDIVKAQEMARKQAWLSALNIMPEKPEVIEPEIIVETPESQTITSIKALWRWDTSLVDYASKRFKRAIAGLEDLNITELTVLKTELEGYGR